MKDEDDQVPCSKKETALAFMVCLVGCSVWVALAVAAWMKWVQK